jgi:hypothetical protein
MIARIPQPNLRFVVRATGEVKDSIWDELDAEYWRQADPAHHEHNVICGMLNRPDWLPIFPDHCALVGGLRWNKDTGQMMEGDDRPQIFDFGIDDLLCSASRFFESFKGKHLGVQLSGGVDSSLIIGILNHLNLPYSLVGMTTSRYEFRTEAFIQRKLGDEAKRTILLNFEDYLPMTSIDSIPSHQQPDLSSCGYSSNAAMAEACNVAGIEVLLTGNGGDVLLGTEVPHDSFNWRTGIFNDNWMQDVVYAPKGVELLSFFADRGIVECIWNMRRGQAEDLSKIWARKYFREFLPAELVNYTFKGDFWGLYIDGLINNLSKLRKIHDQALEISLNPYFSEQNLDLILSNDLLNCDQRLYQRIESRISAAIWFVTLLSKS